MKLNKLQKTTLSIAGVTAMLIGVFIAIDPASFYASYGIKLEGNADMLSELRAPGLNLAVLGMVMLAGIAKSSLRPLAVSASVVVFSSFAAGRLLGILIDGMPSDKVVTALIIEVVIAAMCLAVFFWRRPALSVDQRIRH